MRKFSFLCLLLLLGLSSCITSLHPLYSEDTLVFKPELLGSWSSITSEGVFLIEKAENTKKTYRIIYRENEKDRVYLARLVKLGEQFFFDFFPYEKRDDGGLAYYIPTHNFVKVQFKGKDMTWQLFNQEYMEQLFKERKIRIRHEETDEGFFVLTASTEELQGFFRKYGDNKDAFLDPDLLVKTP